MKHKAPLISTFALTLAVGLAYWPSAAHLRWLAAAMAADIRRPKKIVVVKHRRRRPRRRRKIAAAIQTAIMVMAVKV